MAVRPFSPTVAPPLYRPCRETILRGEWRCGGVTCETLHRVNLWASLKKVGVASSLRIDAGEYRVVTLAKSPNAYRERGRNAGTHEHEADENTFYSKSSTFWVGWPLFNDNQV